MFSRLLLRIKLRIARPFERLLERNTGLLLERNREQADVLSALTAQLAQLANTVSLVQHELADLSAAHSRIGATQSESFAILTARLRQDRTQSAADLRSLSQSLSFSIQQMNADCRGQFTEIESRLERAKGDYDFLLNATKESMERIAAFSAAEQSATQEHGKRLDALLQAYGTGTQELQTGLQAIAQREAAQSKSFAILTARLREDRTQSAADLRSLAQLVSSSIQQMNADFRGQFTEIESRLERAKGDYDFLLDATRESMERIAALSAAEQSATQEHGKRLDALLQAYGTGVGELQTRLQAVAQRVDDQVQSLANRLEGTAQTLTADLQQWAGSMHERLEPLGQFSQRLQTIADDVQDLREKPNIEVLQVHDHKLRSHDSPPALHPVGGWHIGTGIDHPAKLIRERVEMWQQLSDPALLTWHAGLKLIVWPGNDMSRAVFITGQYEPNEMSWLADALDTGMTFVDIGANVGFYSLVASKLVGDTGRVLALEPSKREYQRLSCHVVLNNLHNVDCHALAASDARGTASLRVATDDKAGHNTLGSFVDPATELLREESVPTWPLDELVEELKLKRVDVVKIDVEGAELKVLQGMRRIVERWRPKILFELAPESLAAQNTSVKALLGWFRNQGYKLLEFAETTGIPVEVRDMNLHFGSANLVAVPGAKPSGKRSGTPRSKPE